MSRSLAGITAGIPLRRGQKPAGGRCSACKRGDFPALPWTPRGQAVLEYSSSESRFGED